jgi:Lipopolysaccharide kinase (Kdo/WaaP) family
MSASLWQRLVRGTQRLYARADWEAFAGPDWPECIMDLPATDDFHAKQGRSTGRLVLERDGQRLTVYLKRHYRLPRWRGLLAALWPAGDWSPALIERARLAWAAQQGMPVPAVVAAGEFLGAAGRLQSFLAIEALSGMIALHHAIPLASRQLDAESFRRWKAGLAVEVARLVRMLHTQAHFHKDLYLCHFFIPREDTWSVPEWSGRVHLIDLQRLRRHRLTWVWWIVKDLAQFLYSSEIRGINARDRLSFWRAYLGPLRRTWGAGMLRFLVTLKHRRYRDHNTKRRERMPRTLEDARAGLGAAGKGSA